MFTTDRMPISEKDPETNSTKQNQLLYRISNLGMQDQIQMKNEDVNIAKFGTYIQMLRRVTSHSSFIKVIIPYRDKPNINILQSVEATIRLAPRTVTDARTILKLKQGTEMLDRYTKTTIREMCTSSSTPEFVNLTKIQIATACITYTMTETLIELQTHTKALLIDAESRIRRARREITSLRKWFPKRTMQKRQAEDDSNMTGASFNIVGNTIARTFGLSTQIQMGDAIKAIEAQRQSTLSILTVANRTVLLLDIHKKQINHLNTAVTELQDLVGDVTNLLLQTTTADSIQLKALLHSINLNTAATIFE